MQMFQPTLPKELPPDADVMDRDGRPHVRLRENGRTVYYPLTECGTKYLKKLETWYAEVHQADGKKKPVPLSPNKRAAEMMLSENLRGIEMGKAGAVDAFRPHAVTPLADHMADWADYLRDDDKTPKHVRDSTARPAAVFAACGFAFPPDLDADAARQHLAGLRRADAPGRPRLLRPARAGRPAPRQSAGRRRHREAARPGRRGRRQGPPLPPRHGRGAGGDLQQGGRSTHREHLCGIA